MLSEIIIDKIKRKGPIDFREFMEMALYYPGEGYYTSVSKKIGKDGDFYTSPYATSFFGEMLARQLKEMWELAGEDEFTIVEYGAGEGTLCNDILSSFKKTPALYQRLNYCIIEKSPAMQERQKVLLQDENICWLSSIKELTSFTGCVLANELIDNFSVHLVEMREELMEIFVDYKDGFKEILRPAGSALKAYFLELNVILPYGFRTEINLEAISWINEVAAVLEKGFLLVVDYGFSSNELYAEKRSLGTLLSYYKHSINDSFYKNIGEQDITAHVNFSALKNAGLKNGLKPAGFTNQAFFLQALGLTSYLKSLETENKNEAGAGMEELITAYRFMVNMGQKLKVLIMYKELAQPQLTGMQFQIGLE